MQGSIHVAWICSEHTEEAKNGNQEFINEGEAQLIADSLQTLIQQGYDANELGVVTEHSQQATLIKTLLAESAITDVRRIGVGTINSFQGKQI